jgi:hypothetical protein
MEELISNLQAPSIAARITALEAVLKALPKSFGQASKDTKIRLINKSLNTLKDANPRVVLLGLEVAQQLSESYGDDLMPVFNMAFDLTAGKLGDAKSNIRAKASDVVRGFIELGGLRDGFERLSSLSAARNAKTREGVVHLLLELTSMPQYTQEIQQTMRLQQLTGRLIPFLNDPVEVCLLSHPHTLLPYPSHFYIYIYTRT